MSPLVDQIEALLDLNAKGAVSHPVPGLAVELLTKAAQSLRAQGGVRVKPLEWVEYPNTYSPDVFGHFWDAETPFVRYTVEEMGGADWEHDGVVRYDVNRGREYFICTMDSFDAAKAAAQADYEQRIRSALSKPGAPA